MRDGDEPLDRLLQAVSGWLPAGVAVGRADPGIAAGDGDPQACPRGLLPEEQPATRGMVAGRVREFTAGRVAARRALAALGLAPAAVPMGPDRAPVWPAGVVGSITHGAGACLALAARSSRCAGLGIDLETDAIPEALWAEICTPEELRTLARQPSLARPRGAALIFSAKESAFKCQYPLSGRMLGFAAATIGIDPAGDRFTARLDGPIPRIDGRFCVGSGSLVTVAWLPARPRSTDR